MTYMAKAKADKPLSVQDPHLLSAVGQLKRTCLTTGWILIGFGVLTQIVALTQQPVHPVAGLVYLALGLMVLRWNEPALLGATAVIFALSLTPTLNREVTVLGPDPIVHLIGANLIETVVLVVVKLFLAWSAFSQFQQFRLLYGTERMTSSEASLRPIPSMIPNRTNRLAGITRLSGLVGLTLAAISLVGAFIAPGAEPLPILAETGGALGAFAFGVGFGVAFSPTDRRSLALLGAAAGVVAYFVALATLVL
jgi:ABC-type antimicrobial peptide transport system permease subunit